jgi:hypothetical protein
MITPERILSRYYPSIDVVCEGNEKEKCERKTPIHYGKPFRTGASMATNELMWESLAEHMRQSSHTKFSFELKDDPDWKPKEILP